VVSDLHLGARLGHDVLRHAEALKRLLGALDDVDRLVLLGDIVELLEGRTDQALEVAAPVLRAIGARLGRDRTVLVVPGNHDAALVRPWVRAHASSLRIDTPIEPIATPELELVCACLAPARVEVHYPGAWLSDRVWATHGHYLDRHLLPESAFGFTRGLLGRPPHEHATPSDYELAGGPSASRLEALLIRWLPRPLAAIVESAAAMARAATMPNLPARLLPQEIAPLTATVLGVRIRRASIPALARVAHRLGVGAEWVVFGHIHRLGPLGSDSPLTWSGPGGRPRIANSGCWIYEPRLVHHAAPPHPHWPGGAILIEDNLDPQPISLLDDLDSSFFATAR
jgi:hypothetical protein